MSNDEPRDAATVLEWLSRTHARLHVRGGRVSGSLHSGPREPWAHVQFRQGKDETLVAALDRAIRELHRRLLEGMPQTRQTAPCGACGATTELYFLQSAKQWLCQDCRRGLRQMSDERRRTVKRKRLQL